MYEYHCDKCEREVTLTLSYGRDSRHPNTSDRGDSRHRCAVLVDRHVHAGATPPLSLASLDRRLQRGLAALSHAAVIDDPDVGPMGEGLQAVLMQPILPALHDQEIAEVIHKKFTSGERKAMTG